MRLVTIWNESYIARWNSQKIKLPVKYIHLQLFSAFTLIITFRVLEITHFSIFIICLTTYTKYNALFLLLFPYIVLASLIRIVILFISFHISVFFCFFPFSYVIINSEGVSTEWFYFYLTYAICSYLTNTNYSLSFLLLSSL